MGGDSISRDDIAGELLALGGVAGAIGSAGVAGVEHGDAQAAEVAIAFGDVGDAREDGIAVALATSLIIAEKEGFVLLNFAAERAAELVPERAGDVLAAGAIDRIGLRKGIARGTVLIAAVLEGGSVELIAARFGLDGDDGLAGLTELGVVGGGGDFQFRHGVEIGSDDGFA